MGRADAVHIKARAVLRDRGHPDGDGQREYKDWHIEIRSGARYTSVWSSGRMVFLSMANIPVFYQGGQWEAYLDRLFHHLPISDREPAP